MGNRVPRDIGIDLGTSVRAIGEFLLKEGTLHQWRPVDGMPLAETKASHAPTPAAGRLGLVPPVDALCDMLFIRSFALIDNVKATSLIAAHGSHHDNVVALSLAPVARAALEALAYIYWPCEPNLETGERLRRMAADLVKSDASRGKLDTWSPDDLEGSFAPPWDEIAGVLKAWEVPHIRAAKAPHEVTVLDGEDQPLHRPGAQEIIAPLMRSEDNENVGAFVYSDFTDLAHASWAGIIRRAQRSVLEDGTVHYGFSRERQLSAVGILPWAMHRPLEAYFDVMGWDTDGLGEIVGSAIERMTPHLMRVAKWDR